MKLNLLQQIIFNAGSKYCYLSDNNFAYKKDLYDINPTDDNFKRMYADSKRINFVPTWDTWCLYCDNKSAGNRCAGCKHVYFCNAECQKKAWPIHKKHCKRNLFMNCATCGSKLDKLNPISCSNCPVKWCTEECKEKLIVNHKDFDCKQFKKLFKK